MISRVSRVIARNPCVRLFADGLPPLPPVPPKVTIAKNDAYYNGP